MELPTDDKVPRNAMKIMRDAIAELWTGRTPLPRAFWEYAIGYGTLLNLVTTFASFAALAAGAGAVIAIALHFLPLPYNILVVVGVWRSSDNYDGPAIWAVLSRVCVIVWAVIASIA
jgi:hypothetical protein